MSQAVGNDDRRKFATLIDQGVPVQTAGHRIGISPSVAHRWAAMYRGGGLERLAPLGPGQVRYPFSVKYLAVRASREGAGEAAILEEFLRGRTWPTVEEFLPDLDGYIHWFNHARIHTRLGDVSPRHYRLAHTEQLQG